MTNDLDIYFACGSGGEVLWWGRLSVCPQVHLRNHTRDLYHFLCACCLWPWLGPPPTGWRNPKGKGQFWGLSGPFKSIGNLRFRRRCQVRCKGIIQYSSQAQIGIRKILSGGDAAYWSESGWRECTARARYDIYNFLVNTLVQLDPVRSASKVNVIGQSSRSQDELCSGSKAGKTVKEACLKSRREMETVNK